MRFACRIEGASAGGLSVCSEGPLELPPEGPLWVLKGMARRGAASPLPAPSAEKHPSRAQKFALWSSLERLSDQAVRDRFDAGNIFARFLRFTAWQSSAGALILSPIALIVEPPLPPLSATNLAGLVGLGLVGTAATSAIWFRGVARLEPGAVSILGMTPGDGGDARMALAGATPVTRAVPRRRDRPRLDLGRAGANRLGMAAPARFESLPRHGRAGRIGRLA